jgi:DNA-binding FadR family transcriptional regulator
MARLMEVIERALLTRPWLAPSGDRARQAYREHEALVAAIRTRDAPLAFEVARDHIEAVAQRFSE